jgi:hypothetical protein
MSTMIRLDLDALRDLLRPVTSTASVYFGLEPPEPTADGGEDLHLRWRAMAGRLHAGGADDATVATIEEYLFQRPGYPADQAVFAAHGEILQAHAVPGAIQRDLAAFGAPARIGPLLSWLRRHPPHVVVVTDRTGADLTAVPRGALTGSARTVLGPDDEVERNAPGGWSQPRYHRRAEDSWQHNAAAVAEAVVVDLHRVKAELVLVAGDLRAAQLLRERLARLEHTAVVLPLPGGRSEDGSSANRRAAIVRALDLYATERAAAELSRFETAGGAAGVAVQGLQSTLAALAAGRVSTLLVADDPADARPAWFGEHLLGASNPAAERALEHACRRGRMVDVAIRAALLTRAEVLVLAPGQAPGLSGGIGAVCRY